MSEDRQNRAPRHPRFDRRSLVLWTAGGGAVADVACEERDVVGAIALPLRRVAGGAARAASGGDLPAGGARASACAAQLARARVGGLGVALPGQAWLNQLEPAARPAGFDALPYAQPAPLSLERERLTPAAAADYAEAYLDAQLAAGATLVTTPAHVFAAELGAGREQELTLAEAALRCWQERQGWRPPPQLPAAGPRELHAALAVRPERLPGTTAELTAAYAALPVDGYWLTLVDGGTAAGHRATAGPAGAARETGVAGAAGGGSAAEVDLAAQAAAVAELALGLQEASGRPVTVAGAGHLHAALLASGVAATCVGAEAARPVFPPRALDADGVTGIAAPVWHPAILGFLPAGAAAAEARTALFATDPCRCGAHVAFEPPAGRRETLAHNRWCLIAETRDAVRLVPPLDEARLAARAARAARARRRLGLPPLSPAWAAVAETAQSRRARRAAAPA